jgi:hypothetical protein
MQVRAAHLDLLEEHGRRPVVEVGGHGMRRAAAAGHVRDLRAQLVDAVEHAGQACAAGAADCCFCCPSRNICAYDDCFGAPAPEYNRSLQSASGPPPGGCCCAP